VNDASHEGELLGARLIWTRLTPIDVTEMVCAVDRQLPQVMLPADVGRR